MMDGPSQDMSQITKDTNKALNSPNINARNHPVYQSQRRGDLTTNLFNYSQTSKGSVPLQTKGNISKGLNGSIASTETDPKRTPAGQPKKNRTSRSLQHSRNRFGKKKPLDISQSSNNSKVRLEESSFISDTGFGIGIKPIDEFDSMVEEDEEDDDHGSYDGDKSIDLLSGLGAGRR